jgi:signal transduction histidine kinase
VTTRTHHRLADLRRIPRPTVRLRLTLLYGALFLFSGAGLLAITYLLARGGRFITVNTGTPLARTAPLPIHGALPPGASIRHTPIGAHQQSVIDLHQLLVLSAIALAIMAVVSIGLGWLVAGRVLVRLRTITRAAREISATNLHQRLELAGPDDELTELGSTFDELLARLEVAFNAQQQFVANASHELRTPLARQRTLIEIALGDPEATIDSLRDNYQRVLKAGEQQERLIEALLTLARSEQRLDHEEALDLAAITRQVLLTHKPEATARGLHIDATLTRAPTAGDRRLIERMIANLIDNAIRHNVPSGCIEIRTGLQTQAVTATDQAVLTVSSTGPMIPSTEVERLFEPFQRLATDRLARSDGLGLGLSIARAIATAHGASLSGRINPEGGLLVNVSFRAIGPSP